MGSQAPSTSASIWHRPRAYGTIVGLYLFLMSAIAIGVLIPIYTNILTGWNPCKATSGSGEGVVGCSGFIVTSSVIVLLSAGIVGVSIAAGVMLLREKTGEYVGALTYGALLVWSVLSFLSVLGPFFGSGNQFNWWYFILALSLFSANVLMHKFFFRRYPKL